MATLNYNEKNTLETLFKMSTGYVLNFSDRTFGIFVLDLTGKDIHAYDQEGTSKANKLRTFFKREDNYVVAILIEGLLDYCKIKSIGNDFLYEQCTAIITRLKQLVTIPFEKITEEPFNDKVMRECIAEIKKCVNENKAEIGLDRVHTFATKFLRFLCKTHDQNKTLHGLLGSYTKENECKFDQNVYKILKAHISIFEQLNEIRNQKSLAHPNTLLDKEAAMLITKNVLYLLEYLHVHAQSQEKS